MALKKYEKALQLDTLYEISKKGGLSGIGNTLTPYISIKGGSVDIHAITSATQPTALTDMELADADTGVSATREISTAVRYIAITQNAGTTTEIVTSGIDVKPLGVIS